MKNLKTNKAITLIALIVTIVVLLILAVVTIRAVQGDGIIAKTKETTTNYQIAQEKEQIVLGYQKYQLDKEIGSNAALEVDNALVSVDGTNGWTITFKDTNNKYTLLSNGTIDYAGVVAGPWIQTKTTVKNSKTGETLKVGDYVNLALECGTYYDYDWANR